MEVHLQRRSGLEAADDVGFFAKEGLDKAFSLRSIFGGSHGAGQQHGIGAHRRHAHLGIGHRHCQHLIDAANVRSDPDIGRKDHIAACVAGVDGGFTARLAEHIQLALRFDLHIGNGVIGDEHVRHRAGHRYQLAAADRQDDFLRRANDLLGNRRGRGHCHHRDCRKGSHQQLGLELACHGLSPLGFTIARLGRKRTK